MINRARCNLWRKWNRITIWLIYRCSVHRKWNWTFVIDRARGYIWWKRPRTMTWLIVQVSSTSKMKLNCHDWLGMMQFMIKMKLNSDVTDLVNVGYTENETELSWLIGWGKAYDKSNIRQGHDGLYMCSLHRKWSQTIVTLWIGWDLW